MTAGVSKRMAQKAARLALEADIAEHIAKVGKKDWHLVMNRHPEIGERTFWRARDRVVNVGVPKATLTAGSIKKAHSQAKKNLPAPVSPGYIERSGKEGLANINFLAMFGELFRDVDDIREWSSKPKPDGAEGRLITNPLYFTNSIKLRRELIETHTRVMREVYELQQVQATWNLVFEEIMKESPECRDRILRRLAALNAERGFTVHANPGSAPPPEETGEASAE